MGKVLAETVVFDGQVHDAGTAWSQDLDGIPARFWDGGDDAPASPGEPGESWTVADLQAYAAEHGIDLGGASKKSDILTAIAGAN